MQKRMQAVVGLLQLILHTGLQRPYNRHMNTKITLKQIRQGSVVQVRGDFGNAAPQRATVTCVEADVKNGIPGIDYRLSNGDRHWAYLYQVDSVERY